MLCNTIPTGAILFVLITILGPISGGHFNPVVTAVFAARHEISFREGVNYIAAQLIGGVTGTLLAHLMFAHGTLMASGTVRTGLDQWLAEFVATFGLITVIFGGIRFRPAAVPALVGLYITAAYWFTASTSFANPAVAIARSLTDTFSGIRPMDLPGFVVAEFAGGFAAMLMMGWLLAGQRLDREADSRNGFSTPTSGASRSLTGDRGS